MGVGTLFLAGCGGDGSVETEGPKSTTITTQATVAGALVNWTADLSGDDNGTYTPVPCDPNADSYCIQDLGGVSQNGAYIFYTDDIPANWNIGATDVEGDYTCPQGSSWEGTLTTTGPILTCGDDETGQVIVTPSDCHFILNNTTGQIEDDNCPSTVTLSIPSPVTMSTAYAMTVGAYDSIGDSEGSNSITASSPTSITVPAPTTPGANAILVVDPTTNQVIAAGLFTVGETVINPCGNEKNCGG